MEAGRRAEIVKAEVERLKGALTKVEANLASKKKERVMEAKEAEKVLAKVRRRVEKKEVEERSIEARC